MSISDWAPAALAFFTSAFVAIVEILTSKYPSTASFLLKSKTLWVYGIIYAVIGAGVTLSLDWLIANDLFKLEGLGLSNPYVKALAVGVAIKACLHIRLFSVNVNSQMVPIGLETLVQVFEPWLLRHIDVFHFNAIRSFLKAASQEYADLEKVKKEIAVNIPRTFSKVERDAFLADLDRADNVEGAMELFLGFLGKGTFLRVFPPRDTETG